MIPKHLFILSGQSNIQRLKLETITTPLLDAFDRDQILLVKEAWGGKPLQRWYKSWQPAAGAPPPAYPNGKNVALFGDLYLRLTSAIKSTITSHNIYTGTEGHIASATLIWLQGEEDTCAYRAESYAQHLMAFMQQCQTDIRSLTGQPLNYVIGRINRYGINCAESALYWQQVRNAQVTVAEQLQTQGLQQGWRSHWIDTDNFDCADDQLHFSEQGYQQLGAAFVTAALKQLA